MLGTVLTLVAMKPILMVSSKSANAFKNMRLC